MEGKKIKIKSYPIGHARSSRTVNIDRQIFPIDRPDGRSNQDLLFSSSYYYFVFFSCFCFFFILYPIALYNIATAVCTIWDHHQVLGSPIFCCFASTVFSLRLPSYLLVILFISIYFVYIFFCFCFLVQSVGIV